MEIVVPKLRKSIMAANLYKRDLHQHSGSSSHIIWLIGCILEQMSSRFLSCRAFLQHQFCNTR